MNKEQLMAELKKLGVDVAALEAANVQLAEIKPKADKHDVLLSEVATLKTDKQRLEGEVDTLKKGQPDVAKIVELSESVKAITTENSTLKTQLGQLELAAKKSGATVKVEALLREGKLVPAQRDIMIELAVKDEATFTKLTENAPVVVPLGERGITPSGDRLGDQNKLTVEQTNAEVDRLVKAYVEPRKLHLVNKGA